MSTENIKRIINDLHVEKASSGEIPASGFKKYDFIFGTVTACVSKAMASGVFLEGLKCANVNPNRKKKFKKLRKTIDQWVASKVYERVI